MTSSETSDTLARIAYEAYCNDSGWVSVKGEPLPLWTNVQKEIKGHWHRVAVECRDRVVTGESSAEMICALCAWPFMNAASLIVFRPVDTEGRLGDPLHLHGRGGTGLEELLRLTKVHPKYELLINGVMVRDFTPVTQVEGTLVCAVHTFDLLERSLRGGYR